MARPRRSESTREALIQAGITQLSAYGYHGSGIKQILDEVNVPKGSFYNFFGSKDAFVAELIDVYSQNLINQIVQFIKQDETELNTLDKLKAITLFSINTFEKSKFSNSCLIATISTDIDDKQPLSLAMLNQSIERCQKLFTLLFKQAQDEGLIRLDIMAEQLAKIYWSTWQGSLIRMRISKNKTDAQNCMMQLLALL
ncbi:TetR/AcrR family transcriptional regulator [Shewanella surugensis]|uniref:TetR/AcrR family transcriptional regulator n=1 Tax=Shewanella surugensis TaxID=212020 RepID=A0ABT0LC24_9GAMM|nr:TetR/AcrR family transcriptional regulator [Shewanella surugensis]MCL1125124.1 TetR/AcrR family transcriptional regulator [Shewanella surugensis]